MEIIDKLSFDEKGLIPAIIQDTASKEVLMMAYMNREALEKTLKTKRTWFYSRSRQKLWNKGETSGNYQTVKKIFYDCDGDTLLIEVIPAGNACHTGKRTCFFQEIFKDKDTEEKKEIIRLLDQRIRERKKSPIEGSYTNYLFEKGIDKILKKIAEEAGEVIISAKNTDKKESIYEISDLIYHTLVLMAEKDITIDEIEEELLHRYNK
ncbi:bifunctional phosphoribosyl-AMP cyclohydrolase/phosphoribosyl-ATP diphosphatase HisIE [Geosporobacter ferrireducens]|uniref:Histidine biosynthesis bifunctional protein HisIE n=1 Tax=Geosporobacter ferrireducens TaxID=1424294 RepID=A0A1D8GNZ6_9FIRM|nr:bifunctional phosphoribosyl-AMP cyclohydrolase/phosphoribosyl-ATP diphosphatase HisIE [Geosporobacter ferrireducens]AOT72676.1 bifunctional phosphoribosyl-AMP cyclohydrolase/phosphoribosyl-ATP pyrophosphatase [Geosporobacter ferrireducens]MTI55084.1 bifunctional phosphoribosyl-AMP cyclohydrolase/phosphoribosyl-ATP diphosphatase HisIE [Geosporobacter ferrireducens]